MGWPRRIRRIILLVNQAPWGRQRRGRCTPAACSMTKWCEMRADVLAQAKVISSASAAAAACECREPCHVVRVHVLVQEAAEPVAS
jgi:hypothetical protein